MNRILIKKYVIAILIVVCIHITSCGHKEAQVHEETLTNIIDRAGGLAKINAEAMKMLDRFGTKTDQSMNSSDLSEFDSISAMGDSILIGSEDPNNPACVEIRSGSRDNPHYLFIYDERKLFKLTNHLSWVFTNSPSLIRVSTNIFYLK